MTGSEPDEPSFRDAAYGRVGDARVLVPRERDPLTGRLTSAGDDRPGKRRRSPDHARSRPRFSRGVLVTAAVVGVLAVAGVAAAVSSGGNHKTAVSVQAGTTTARPGATTPTSANGSGLEVESFKMRPAGKGIQSVSYTVNGEAQPNHPYQMLTWFTCDANGCVLWQSGTPGLPLRGAAVKGRLVEQTQDCPGSLYDTYDLRVTKFVEVAGIRVPGAVTGKIVRTNESCHGTVSAVVVGQGSTELESEGVESLG